MIYIPLVSMHFWGHSTFTAMIKNVFELELGGDSMDDILARAKFEGLNMKRRKWYHVKRKTYVNLKKLRDDMTNDQKVEFSRLHDNFEGHNKKECKWYHDKCKTYVNLKKLGDDMTNDQKVEFSCLNDKFDEGYNQKIT